MSIRESRKKVQRSIVFISTEFPSAVALPELRKIQQTVNGAIEHLAGPEKAPDSPARPDWRVGLTVKPMRHDDPLHYEQGTVEAVLPSGTNGIICDYGVLQIRLDSGTVILRAAGDWITA